jgi:hypothetical protein
MRPLVPPLLAILIPSPTVCTLHPSVEDLEGIWEILGDHEARINHCDAVAVAKVAVDVERIPGHGEGGVAGNVPSV